MTWGWLIDESGIRESSVPIVAEFHKWIWLDGPVDFEPSHPKMGIIVKEASEQITYTLRQGKKHLLTDLRMEKNNMYGLSKDIDLSFLVGKELQSVCVAFCTVQLHFDGNTGIGVEGRFAHQVGTKTFEWNSDIPHTKKMTSAAASVFGLLATSIVSVKVKRDGTLRLSFSNKNELTLYDETPMYQAYRIWNNDNPMIVV